MNENGEGTGRDYIGYSRLVDVALRGVLRAVLRDIQQRGLVAGHHLYIRYNTASVPMPDWLRTTYPSDMTIVLQNNYRGLRVEHDRFSVILNFKRVPVELVIPFDQVIGFNDPWIGFGLQFETALRDSAAPPVAVVPPQNEPAEVVNLESFRRPKE